MPLHLLLFFAVWTYWYITQTHFNQHTQNLSHRQSQQKFQFHSRTVRKRQSSSLMWKKDSKHNLFVYYHYLQSSPLWWDAEFSLCASKVEMSLGACVGHVGQRQSDDLQALSKNTSFFLFRSSMTTVFCRRLTCVYSCWRNQDVLRGLKPTGLVLLMTGPVSSSFSLAKFSNPSNDLRPSWTGSLKHLAMVADECALCQGSTCTQAALQCWEWWLLALLRGKEFRAKNWECIENKAVCSIATFEYWNKLPCTPVQLCLLDKVSI